MPERNRIRLRTLVAVAACLIWAVVVGIGVTVWKLRSDAVDSGYQGAANLATVLSDQTTQTVRTIDRVLIDVQDRLYALGIIETNDLPMMATKVGHLFLKTYLERFPQAEVVSLIGKDGRIMVSSRGWPTDAIDVSDRDYFRQFSQNADTGTFISEPVVNRSTGTPMVFFARRISRSDNSFLGVVVVGVPLRAFEHVYESVGLLDGMSFLFLRRDGTVLVRYPDQEIRAGAKLSANSPWHEQVAKGSGRFYSSGVFDGVPRLISVQTVPGYALVVNVAVSEEMTLRVWRHLAVIIAVGTLLAAAFASFLLYMLVRNLNQLKASRRELANKSRDLKRAHTVLDAAVTNISQGISMFDRDQRLEFCNPRYYEIYGLSPDIIKPGCTMRDILELRKKTGDFTDDPEEYLPDFTSRIGERKNFSHLTTNIGGRVISINTHPMEDGGWVALHEDITERYLADKLTAHMARHDALTDLPNRIELEQKFIEALQRLQRHDEKFAVLVFDLDKFKEVNDTLGHPVGDALLKAASQRLLNCVREFDTVARLGGDEFAILLAHLDDPVEGARKFANRVLDVFETPFELGKHTVRVGTSIGIALAPRDGANIDTLMANADYALYRAKAQGRNSFRFFDSKEDTPGKVIEAKLRTA